MGGQLIPCLATDTRTGRRQARDGQKKKKTSYINATSSKAEAFAREATGYSHHMAKLSASSGRAGYP